MAEWRVALKTMCGATPDGRRCGAVRSPPPRRVSANAPRAACAFALFGCRWRRTSPAAGLLRTPAAVRPCPRSAVRELPCRVLLLLLLLPALSGRRRGRGRPCRIGPAAGTAGMGGAPPSTAEHSERTRRAGRVRRHAPRRAVPSPSLGLPLGSTPRTCQRDAREGRRWHVEGQGAGGELAVQKSGDGRPVSHERERREGGGR